MKAHAKSLIVVAGLALAVGLTFRGLDFPWRDSSKDESAAVRRTAFASERTEKAKAAVASSRTPAAVVPKGATRGKVPGLANREVPHNLISSTIAGSGSGSERTKNPAAPVRRTLGENEYAKPSKGLLIGRVIDYRTLPLPPVEKGGAPGELREWLVEPPEGYVSHLEEEYRPAANGEMVLAGMRQYAANQVLLKLDGDKSFEDFKSALEKDGLIVKEPLVNLRKGARIVAVMASEPTFDAVSELSSAVSAYDPTLKPETDNLVVAERVPNDTKWASLWGMQKIKAPDAWNTRTDAPSVIVAVLDSGIRYNHEDISANMWRNPSPGSTISGLTGDTYGIRCIGGTISNDPMDDVGHGTHCAGTIGGVGNNGKGVAGVCWNVKLMALKWMFPYQGSGVGYNSDSYICIAYGAVNGAKIFNCSFGGTGSDSNMRSLMQELQDYGAICVCAAGNDGTNNETVPHYPSSYPLDNIVAVAATDSSDRLCSFSCYGSSSVDIAAPGEGIWSTVCSSSAAYDSYNGTSMATPHVAGALALIMAQYPNESYLQTIQRLYTAGDPVSSLGGKVKTGKRLNVANALPDETVLVAPVVSASDGAYADKIRVSWAAVSGATHYRVYRATSASGTKTALGDWQTSTSFDDATAVAGTTYYYWGKAAKSSSGSGETAYGESDTGYVGQGGDRWDPGDDTASGATALTPSLTAQSHGPHTLSQSDPYDFFKVAMTAGTTYTFETTGSSDTYGELYGSSTISDAAVVARNDDGGTDGNFKIVYTPTSTKTYYLRVRCYNTANSGTYTLDYSVSGGDIWDPGDDMITGATALSVSRTAQTHGPHTLDQSDAADFFKFVLSAGKTYEFWTTGEERTMPDGFVNDPFGELYFNSQATRVAYDDDGNGGRNFRISYTPTSSGTYYLRVRSYAGNMSEYVLNWREAAAGSNPDMLYTDYRNYNQGLGWPVNGFLVADPDSVTPRTEFDAGEEILLNWAYNEANFLDVPYVFTNAVDVLDANGAVIAEGQFPKNGVEAGYWTSNQTTLPELDPGAYTARVRLNTNLGGYHAFSETNFANNVLTVGFTVRSGKTLTELEINGNASIVSKGTASYTCRATYSDGTRTDIAPSWSIVSGGSYASLDATTSARITLRAADVGSTRRDISLRATYGGKTVTKQITITPEAGGGEDEIKFDSPRTGPNAPMVVHARVRINNALAETGDQLAAYVGNEVRGYARIDATGYARMSVYVSENDERVSFKVYDRSYGDEGDILDCTTAIPGRIGSIQGSATAPIEIDAVRNGQGGDPFGPPNMPSRPGSPTVIEAKVTIDGSPAQAGDILAAFDGETLVAKQNLRFRSSVASAGANAGTGEAYCRLTMYLSGSTTLSFKVYDASEDSIWDCTTTLRANAGGAPIGSDTNRTLIEAQSTDPDNDPQTLTFANSGWNLVSFRVLPESGSAAEAFAPVAGSIDYVINGWEIWAPGDSEDMTLEIGKGYWVYSKRSNVSLRVEGRGEPDKRIALQPGWNLVGYTLPRGGEIVNVLRTAISDGNIIDIVSGSASYPGNLRTMSPGVGYWVNVRRACSVNYERGGMAAAYALSTIMAVERDYGPFGDGSDIRTDSVSPTMLRDCAFTIFGRPAAIGDCVAVFRKDNGDKVAVARIEDESGRVTIPILLDSGVGLHFKIWSSASGEADPVIYDCDPSCDFVTPTPGSEVGGKTVSVSGAAPSFRVTFDLGGKGVRTGGGELVQQVAFGRDAVEPVVRGSDGYEFKFWDDLYTDIRADRTVKAVWKSTGGQDTPPTPSEPTLLLGDIAGEYPAKSPIASIAVEVLNVPKAKVAVKGLPTGLKYKNGEIAGTPSKSGIFKATVTVTSGDRAFRMDPIVRELDFVIRSDGEQIVRVTCDSDKGKVTGSGVYVRGKKVSLKATPTKGYVFVGWAGAGLDSKAASLSYQVRDADVEIVAEFVSEDEDFSSITLDFAGIAYDRVVSQGSMTAYCGVGVDLPVVPGAMSQTTVKAARLPSGLKLVQDRTTKAYSIKGVPTTASKRGADGAFEPIRAQFTVTSAAKIPRIFTLDVTVVPLPDWAFGTFSGGGEAGKVDLSVSKVGKISGKWLSQGLTWTLSAPSFNSFSDGSYGAEVNAKSGKAQNTIRIVMRPLEMSAASGTVEVGSVEADPFVAYQDNWKLEPWKSVGKAIANSKYDESDDGISLKFAAKGSVSVALSRGSYRASGTSTLLPQSLPDEQGRFYGTVFVYLPPKAGKFEGLVRQFILYWNGQEFVPAD